MGGGTSLVEAARMGANVHGRDVDPLATLVVQSELTPSASRAAAESAVELLEHLSSSLGDLWSGHSQGWTPLHWFWLRKPECPDCGETGLLYKDLLIASSIGLHGSVVRDVDKHAFCPDCLKVHSLATKRKTVICCGRSRHISDGTYADGKYRCSSCGARSSHERLSTGKVESVLIAVEETMDRAHRRIRSATADDLAQISRARELAARRDGSRYNRSLETVRRDRRPLSLGFDDVRSLFTDRQWLLFVTAFEWLRASDHNEATRRALTLLITGSLASNNALCGYAREYGRLAPLFSVRGYSLPTLSVELNPLHPKFGRGTLRSGVQRLERAGSSRLARNVVTDRGLVRKEIDLPVRPGTVDVICASADDPTPQPLLQAEVCVTDPPYFDYIAYSELSEFFRAWIEDPGLGGVPLLPDYKHPVTSFAAGLAACLKTTLDRLRPGTPVVFTYHSRDRDAWRAIGEAFDSAQVLVTALWPVLADPQMGHHRGTGNCDFDVVVVCRVKHETRSEPLTANVVAWTKELTDAGLSPNEADQLSFMHAIEMASERSGRVNPDADCVPSRPSLVFD